MERYCGIIQLNFNGWIKDSQKYFRKGRKKMKLRMKVLVILWIAVALIAGCGWFSSEPDEETIQNAFLYRLKRSSEEWTIVDFKITNQYEKEINQEHAYIYEAQFRLKSKLNADIILPGGTLIFNLTCGLVHRGNSWYAL
jgi:hypothetical protein